MDNDDKDNVTPIRRKNGTFVKGQSGNPQGGNKPYFLRDLAGNKHSIRDLYLDNAGAVFGELLRIIMDTKSPATARISAIKEFNDRAFGKSVQSIRSSNTTEIEAETIDASLLDDAVLAALTNARKATESSK
jgi:hypothetical protein